MKLLDAVAIVTPEHGETFAKELGDVLVGQTDAIDAFAATGVIPWPDDDEEAQMNQIDIVDEIMARTFEAVRPAIVSAFVKAANDVLAEERQRGFVKGE